MDISKVTVKELLANPKACDTLNAIKVGGKRS